jgi:hypothetical protein
MARLMTAARLGVVVLLAVAILGAIGTFSFRDVSAAGRAGAAKVPTLFQGNGHGGGNGNGHGGGNGNGNGHGNGNGGVTTDQTGEQDGDTDQGNGHAKKNKKAKKDKAKDQAEDSADDANDDEGEDAGSGKKNPQSGNVDCNDVEGMIEYLKNRNMNGALHANPNGADNAAAGALNKCMNHGPENGDDSAESDVNEDGTPVAEDATPEADDATPVAESGTPIAEDEVEDGGSDKPVSVKVDIDEDGNGTIEYDLDGDGETDLTMIVEDGKVVEYVDAGDAADATPEATPDTATE